MKHHLQYLYTVTMFLLSLYLVFSLVVEFTPWFAGFKSWNLIFTNSVVLLFAMDLIVNLILAEKWREFIKEQWVAIVAIILSLAFLQAFHTLAGAGFVLANKVTLLFRILKAYKLLKIGKLFKLFKSYKLGKKAIQLKKEKRDSA